MKPQTIGDYTVIILSYHSSDNHLGNNNTQWWLLYNEYGMDEKYAHIYGSRILFGPNSKPNAKKYILWIDFVNLTDPSCLFITQQMHCFKSL